MRCLNCNVFVIDKEFCSDKCRHEYSKYYLNKTEIDVEASAKGYYGMVIAMIHDCLTNTDIDKKRGIDNFIHGRNNKIIDLWCDCSDAVCAEKLRKQYDARTTATSSRCTLRFA